MPVFHPCPPPRLRVLYRQSQSRYRVTVGPLARINLNKLERSSFLLFSMGTRPGGPGHACGPRCHSGESIHGSTFSLLKCQCQWKRVLGPIFSKLLRVVSEHVPDSGPPKDRVCEKCYPDKSSEKEIMIEPSTSQFEYGGVFSDVKINCVLLLAIFCIFRCLMRASDFKH